MEEKNFLQGRERERTKVAGNHTVKDEQFILIAENGREKNF
jgi:hypothetical protein